MARLGTILSVMVFSKNFTQAVNTVMPPIISVSEESAVAVAAKMILNGDVVALPTDTIYGIAVSAQNNNGIKKLYEIKKRNKDKPIAICISGTEEIPLWGETSHLDNALLNSLLPGAVTVVLRRKSLLNPLLNPNNNLIGIRIPKFPFIQNLSRACGVPLALTSANLSSEESPLQVSEFSQLWPELGGIFDAGALSKFSVDRAGSTVVDLSLPNHFSIIRQGSALESTLSILEKFNLKAL